MKLYIPQLGDKIKLETDWEFTLFNEYRNEALISYFNVHFTSSSTSENTRVIIPKDSILSIDRVFIRKGSKGYSSLTFYWEGKRFWVKLADVNNINYTFVESSIEKTKIRIILPENAFTDKNKAESCQLKYFIDDVPFVELDFFKAKQTQTITKRKSILHKKVSTTYYELVEPSSGAVVTETGQGISRVRAYIREKHNLTSENSSVSINYKYYND